jgi:hypothetical protein
MSRIIESDRITYIYLKLVDTKQKKFIEELIQRLEIASISTARRRFKDIDEKFSKSEKKLFIATYTPVKSDSEAIDEVLGIKLNKVSNEIVEDDKCTECDTEAAHIINELSAKNQELQKELHTSKNVITTLQKGTEELNEVVTESKCMIAEICKERDDKDEEIRVLRLDLIRKDNDMDKLEEDFTEAAVKYENLLEVLETKKLDIELNPKYDRLYKVLLAAYNQASNGKGKERHQLNDDEPFENQKICEIARRLSIDYNLGQAVKKIYESKRLTDRRDIAELYGAINYIAAAIIVKQEEKQNG